MAVSDAMTQVKPLPGPPQAPSGHGVVVHRPRTTDAIGISLRHAFAPDQALPDHLAHPLTALGAWR